MSQGIKIIFLILGGGIAIGLILYVVAPWRTTISSGEEVRVAESANTLPLEIVTVPPSSVPPKEVVVSPHEAALQGTIRQIAIAFVERYGSMDVLPLLAASWSAQYQKNIASQKITWANRVLSVDIPSIKQDDTKVKVELQVQGNKGEGNEVVVQYKKVEVVFVKEGTDWKVAGLVWN